MSSASTTERASVATCCRALARSVRRGLTLVELMIVALIVLIFTGSAATVFIQLIQTSDAVDARIEAVKNCRFFLDTLSADLAQASVSFAIPRPVLLSASRVID